MEEPVSISSCSELSHHDNSPISISLNSNHHEDEILIVSVEISEGKRDVIRVYDKDHPETLAKEFAEKHGLDPKLEIALADHIAKNRQLANEKLGQNMFNDEESSIKHWKTTSNLF